MTLNLVLKLIGALGLVFITIGVVERKRIRQNIYFIIGGLLLEIYAVYLRDIIYIPLQLIFVAASAYEIYHLKTTEHPVLRFFGIRR
jgi:hypothetical protein